MYKLLLFLHKTNNDEAVSHFYDYTIKYLSDMTGNEIKVANIESNLLLDVKYSKFCEITVDSKEVWDRMMSTREGRLLNKDLTDLHQFITVIFVNYEQ